jgi:ligand-binding sensor domain-containing protein/signal transduction histidine kinase/DNA-binding response OmpR family regulator
MTLRKYLFILLNVFAVVGASAQPYYFKHYLSDDGLSDNAVICGLQDRKGFTWFGTKNGLNRFDGYNFQRYRHDPKNKASLGNNMVLTLFEDRSGLLWVGTNNGIFIYDGEHESFSTFKNSPKGSITNITEDSQRNLWFVADHHIYSYDQSKKRLRKFVVPNERITSLCTVSGKKVWLSSFSGALYAFNERKQIFEKVGQYTSTNSRDNAIVKIAPIDDKKLLVGTRSQGIKIFHQLKGNFESVPISNTNTKEFLVTDMLYSNDELWTATEAGIYIYKLKDKSTTVLKKEIYNPYSLSDNFVSFLTKDRESNIWAGTFFGGLNVFIEKFSLFKKYYAPDNNSSLSSNIINNITRDKAGRIWISTADAGLNKLDPRTGQLSRVYFANTKDDTPLNIPSLMISGNELWIGTYEHGLYIMDVNTGKILSHYEDKDASGGLNSNFIVSMYQCKNKEIYVGTSIGLYRYLPKTNSFSLIYKDYIKAITEDLTGTVWVGTLKNGAIAIKPESGKLSNYRNSASNTSSIIDNSVNAIFQDSNQTLWFATESGLCEFDAIHQKFKRYTVKDGLPTETILNILEDGKKNLWISTKAGLVALNLRNKKQLQVFTKVDGLMSNEFNYASALQYTDGRMFFGSCRGLISFDPHAVKKDSYIPPVYITGLQVNNSYVAIANNSPLKRSIIVTKKIKLRYNESAVSFDFAALSFVAPKKLKYAYQMVGLDDGWTILESNRRVYYTNLSPGSYKFRVKASNSSGIWNTQPAEIDLVISPPWWASNFAYALYLCLASAGTFYVIRFYHKRAQEKITHTLAQFENEKEREIYQAKIEFFTHITHEIRTPLTLIKGPLENVMKATQPFSTTQGDLKLVEKNTNRLLELTNQLLDFRKTESKGFNLNFVRCDVAELLQSVAIDFKSLAEQKSCDFVIEAPTEKVFAEVDIDALHKILCNLFSNAIKYADRFICIKLYVTETNFIIESQNDGFLILTELAQKVFEPFFRLPEKNKQQGNGIGLALSRSLAELHHGTLLLNNRQQLNTFLLTLPLHQENAFVFDFDLADTVEVSYHEGDENKPTILVVDDNLEINDFLVKTLHIDFKVISLTNGKEALALIRERTIELILSDVMMPVMDGFELCKAIKTDLEICHIPVILLTAKSALQAKIEGLESGADVYIEKPFSPEHLLAQIKALLKNREMIKSHFANSPLTHIKNMAYAKADMVFLEKLNNIILTNIAEADLDVNKLAEAMNMSKPTLYRKIKAISNLSPNELITIARLKKAAELLSSDDYKIYEIATMVGFNSQTYFGHSFFKQFRMTPKEYAQTKRLEKKSFIN